MSLFQGKSDEIQAGRLLVYFDHGSSLLSDTTLDYPMNQDTRMLICKARPKTFCDAFDEQLDIAEQLYGVQIHFRFSCRDVANMIHSANVYKPGNSEPCD